MVSENPERISVTIPPFANVRWSQTAILYDYPRLSQRYSQAFRHLELESITAGLRDCALIVVAHDAMPVLMSELKTKSLTCHEIMPIVENEGYASGFAAKGTETKSFIAVGSEHNARTLAAAYAQNDHATVAALLNYPQCCATFFNIVWEQEWLKDTIWAMAVNSTPHDTPDRDCIDLEAQWINNILFKSIGVRTTFHLPCSVNCEHSEHLGRSYSNLMSTMISDEVSGFAEILLRLDCQWYAHHGVSLIENELVRVVTNTDFDRRGFRIQLKIAP